MSHVIGKGRYGRSTYPVRSAAITPPAPTNYDNAIYPQEYGARTDVDPDDAAAVAANTVALQAWLDATATLGRRGVMPAGTYYVSATLNVDDPADDTNFYIGGTIEGDGRNLSVVKWAGADNDGSSILVWSRYNTVLRGVKLDGNLLASHGLVMHAAAYSEIDFAVVNTASHGVVIDNEWDGLPHGANFECVLKHPFIGPCGRNTIGLLLIDGATGGTFTLTVNGQTTAAIAYDASGAAIQAALELACTNAKRYATATNFFQVDGNATAAAVYFYGANAGETCVVSIDGALLIDAISSTFTISNGVRGNGIHFAEWDSANNSNGTMVIDEPAVIGAVGHGIFMRGAYIKLKGGLFEGNRDAGVMQAGHDAVYVTDNFMEWPYFENNASGGIINSLTVRTWATVGQGGVQQMYDLADSGNAQLGVGDSSFIMVHRRASDGAGNLTSLGIGENGYGVQQYALPAAGLPIPQPAQVSNVADPSLLNLTHSAPGGLAPDFLQASLVNINLNANITTLLLSPVAEGHLITLRFFYPVSAATTVAWPVGPGGVVWVGGPAGEPVLGTGGINSWDAIQLRWSGTFLVWFEESRELGMI